MCCADLRSAVCVTYVFTVRAASLCGGQMSYGWIECVGHADRACYDLEQHSRRAGVALQRP
jgi:hypothetical protein